jgi:hypothetical protein
MRGRDPKLRLDIGVALLLLLVAVAQANAQEQPPAPPKDEQPKAAASTTPLAVIGASEDDKNPGATAQVSLNPYSGQITQAGTGLPLLGTTNTPLRWGDFSIPGFEYIGIRDSFVPAGQQPGIDATLNIFRTTLMFEHYIRKNRIVLQYLPQMAIFDGQLHANAGTNNLLALGTTFGLTSRLKLTIQDGLVQVHSNELIPERYLSADANAGAAVQNSFLDTNGSFLANSTSATLEYNLSPRSTLTVSPMYRYARVLGAQTQTNYFADGETYYIVATVGYALTERRSVGLVESYQVQEETSASTTPASARFSSTGIFYREQLARSLWVTGEVSAEHQKYSDLPGAAHWDVSSQVGITENLSNRIGLALAYSRGETLSDYITTRRSDRIDGSLGLHLTSRISWNNGVGYFRELGSDPRTIGKYATSGLEYRFYGRFSLFSTFAYSFQDSNTPQLLSGTRKTGAFGIRWTAPVAQSH